MRTWKIGVIAFAALAAKADTVTTSDSRGWNGSVKTIQGGVLTLQARFSNGPASVRFGANYIRAIEFNKSTYNPGAAPNLPNPQGGTLSGTVYTKDKKAHTCANITSDSANVTCEGSKPHEVLSRQNVLRIMIGP